MQLLKIRNKIHDIIASQRETTINKENSLLFNKLIDISMGKRSQLPFNQTPKARYIIEKPNGRKYNVSLSPMRSLPHLKSKQEQASLNFVQRKQEKERIERDNLKLAAKLVTEESDLKKSKLLHDYKKIQEYKKRLRRVRRNSATDKKTKLPSVSKRSIIQNVNDLDNIDNEEEDKEKEGEDDGQHSEEHQLEPVQEKVDQPDSSHNVSLAEREKHDSDTIEHEKSNTVPVSPRHKKQKSARRHVSHKKKKKKEAKLVQKPVNSNFRRYKDQSPGKHTQVLAKQNKYLFEVYKRDPKDQQSTIKKKKHKKRTNKTSQIELQNDMNTATDEELDKNEQSAEAPAEPKPESASKADAVEPKE